MDNYPPGTANDKSAPFNQVEVEMEMCKECFGTGEEPDSYNISKDNPITLCAFCYGKGEVEKEPVEPDPDSMKGGPDYDV